MEQQLRIYPLTPEGIRLARESAGLTPREAAIKLKVSGPALRSWESGGYPPGVRHVSPMAKVYRCSFYIDEVTAKQWTSVDT